MKVLVFTDLDGTLLDHETYSYAAALPAIAALKMRGAVIVMASSKTAQEMAVLHRALELGDMPMIVENGAALVRPDQMRKDSTVYARLRAALEAVPEDLRRLFKGFGDMSVAEVARSTGLSDAQAAQAKARAFSEPGVWTGSKEQEAAFVSALSQGGVQAKRGGRYLTLSFGGTKAGQMQAVIDRYRPDLTIALGDAPNDREMLEAADIGVIIRNDHGTGLPCLAGEETGRIRRSMAQGPEGWNSAILAILAEYEKEEG
ncbi:HAD-IIB family hydrolase [Thioclava litoralis]|uniref:HAD-IIB family hydrolase n=1 Tax=Thioclava litoralis TaxID=3076557 RepID=A0ABZ1E3Y7_9RHOB|nr:HAD-IIB family hydrolase [Thioclava sp. FTW29]